MIKKYAPYLLVAIVFFGLGKYMSHQDITQTIAKETTTAKDTNTKKSTTIIKAPDGTETTTTTEETTTKTRKHEELESHTEIKSEAPLNVSILVATEADIRAFKSFRPIYGLSVSKEYIGPITIGAFGLTNGIVGVSVGVNF